MKMRNGRFAVLLLMLIPITAVSQMQSVWVPLTPWPAPLYWQPTVIENQVSASLLKAVADSYVDATSPPNSLVFVGTTPCRIVDTRTGSGFTGPFGPPSLNGGATRTFPIPLSPNCTIPTIARAYSFNITVVPPGPLTFLTIWPTALPQPTVSTLNDLLGTIVANAAIVPAGANGSVDVFVSHNTDLIIDINGYYAPQTGITLAQGTAAAPSMSFSGDIGTGIFSSGTGALNISTGGTNRLTVRSDGDVELPGSIRKSGFLFLHNLGTANTSVGLGALSVSAGGGNTATGQQALAANTMGTLNTANGVSALGSNTTGGQNTAIGYTALAANTTGAQNTASGYRALASNITGTNNTASGFLALLNNTDGVNNTASGYQALASNTTGGNNIAIGASALLQNTTGSSNTAMGSIALFANTTASSNTAIGFGALASNVSGDSNIALGRDAGFNIVNTCCNIHIGNTGLSSDASTIRIGSVGSQTRLFLAAIRGVTTGQANAVPVVIDSNGQLGTISSSRRFKEDIQDMGQASSGLLRLRPVTFRYKKPYADGSKPLDYGLIAEEVADVFPDLVVESPDGRAETVQYQKLTPMLLNELQKQQVEIETQKQQLRQQSESIRLQQDAIRKLEAQLEALQTLLPTKTLPTTAPGR